MGINKNEELISKNEKSITKIKKNVVKNNKVKKKVDDSINKLKTDFKREEKYTKRKRRGLEDTIDDLRTQCESLLAALIKGSKYGGCNNTVRAWAGFHNTVSKVSFEKESKK